MLKVVVITGIGAIVLTVLGVLIAVRLKAITPEDWQSLSSDTANASIILRPEFAGDDQTQVAALLAQVNEVALSQPRSAGLGDLKDGTGALYLSRSRFWGFPDVTVARAGVDAEGAFVALHGRQVFGDYDWNANVKRLGRWQAAIEQD